MHKMNKKAFTLVEILMVVAIIAILSAIAFPGLIRSRIQANESVTLSNLKSVCAAIETFAAANGGSYPAAITDLTEATPPYLNGSFNRTVGGYDYVFELDSAGTMYTITATPHMPNKTGTNTYRITTGCLFTTLATP